MSEMKTEIDAKEALENEKAAALESRLQKILDGFLDKTVYRDSYMQNKRGKTNHHTNYQTTKTDF